MVTLRLVEYGRAGNTNFIYHKTMLISTCTLSSWHETWRRFHFSLSDHVTGSWAEAEATKSRPRHNCGEPTQQAMQTISVFLEIKDSKPTKQCILTRVHTRTHARTQASTHTHMIVYNYITNYLTPQMNYELPSLTCHFDSPDIWERPARGRKFASQSYHCCLFSC